MASTRCRLIMWGDETGTEEERISPCSVQPLAVAASHTPRIYNISASRDGERRVDEPVYRLARRV